jgi:hypothetical protein
LRIYFVAVAINDAKKTQLYKLLMEMKIKRLKKTMVGLNRKKPTTLTVAIFAFAQWFDLLYVVTLT